jgi:hypothetical protein
LLEHAEGRGHLRQRLLTVGGSAILEHLGCDEDVGIRHVTSDVEADDAVERTTRRYDVTQRGHDLICLALLGSHRETNDDHRVLLALHRVHRGSNRCP